MAEQIRAVLVDDEDNSLEALEILLNKYCPEVIVEGRAQSVEEAIKTVNEVKPEVLLIDEPCSALDPIATAKIEELIDGLKKQFTIVIVTHSMQQAARISDMTAFFNMGKVEEHGDTQKIFTNPDNQKTQDYITGRFG